MRSRSHPGVMAAASAIVASRIQGSKWPLPLVNWGVLPPVSALRPSRPVNGKRHLNGPIWPKFQKLLTLRVGMVIA